jgi:hypothetical protein
MLRKKPSRVFRSMPGRQNGMSVVELLVATVISLVTSSAMIMLMANTLGSSSRTIAMTGLTQKMRASMQIISRDLRRANYLSPVDARTCFANVDCLVDLGFDSNIGNIVIGDDSDGDGYGECLSFWLDRNQSSSFEATEMGAYRLNVNAGIGSIEMLRSFTGMEANNCPSGTWVPITDPKIIDVQRFEVDNSGTYTEIISAAGSTQTVQKIRLMMGASLRNNGAVNFAISREIEDQINIRNNFITL